MPHTSYMQYGVAVHNSSSGHIVDVDVDVWVSLVYYFIVQHSTNLQYEYSSLRVPVPVLYFFTLCTGTVPVLTQMNGEGIN